MARYQIKPIPQENEPVLSADSWPLHLRNTGKARPQPYLRNVLRHTETPVQVASIFSSLLNLAFMTYN